MLSKHLEGIEQIAFHLLFDMYKWDDVNKCNHQHVTINNVKESQCHDETMERLGQVRETCSEGYLIWNLPRTCRVNERFSG